MIPVNQTIYGEEGNCMEACLASLLHLKINEVPKLSAYEEDGSWIIKLNEWLSKRGLTYVEVFIQGDEAKEFFRKRDFYYILIGQTKRNLNIFHAVIARKGEIVHDPFPIKTKFIKTDKQTIGVIVLQCK